MNPAAAAVPPRPVPPAADALAAGAFGALQTLAFVHTAAWPLPLAALAWLVWRLDAATPRRAAWLGACYGTAWLAAGTWWLFVSMHRYGGLPAPLAAVAVALLAGALSLYLALACAAYARWRRGGAGDVALFAALWLLAELARGMLFTGFPWVASGYALVDSPLAALAPWVGVYGIGAMLAFAAAAMARLPRTAGRGWAPAAVAAAVVGVCAAAGPGEFTRPAGSLSVALLQPNVAQDRKFDPEHLPQTLGWVARELVRAEAELVVAPETAVPLLPSQLREVAPGYWDGLRRHFAAPGRGALVGVPLGDFDRGYTNSVAGLSVDGEYRYDKWHLVPFGEFVPPGFRWFTEMMDIPLGDFARGLPNPPSFRLAGQRIAPNICYEDLFGEELALRFADPATAPTLLVNLSNIGWFGRTIAVDQHLQISRMRSLELQRAMIRATNTGATAIVDHRGRVAALLPPHEAGVLTGVVEGRDGVTPYAGWAARAGLAPLWGGALAVVAAGALARRRPAGP